MSDDDPVESFVEGTVEPFGDESDESTGPQTRDMEAELRERMGTDSGESADMGVDSETATAFWGAVVYVNLGILLMALGPVVYAMRGRALVAAILVVAGIGVLGRAYMVYREFDADDEPSEDSGDGGGDADANADDGSDDG